MLPTTVALHDIDDVEGFVAAAIERSGIRRHLEPSEYEDLKAEGICILYQLASSFEPQRPGYSAPGRFSGYAAQMLPRRLGDAWHQSHPEHRRLADETGKRRWHYLPAPLSLEAELEGKPGHSDEEIRRTAESRIRRPEEWAALTPA